MTGQTAVVIVEDSEQSLRRLESAVNEIPGLELVGSAATPSEAIELTSTLRPGILILDLYLLGGSGVEVLEAIGGQQKDTNVVVVTNQPSAALNEACRNLGARFFFDKSLEFEELQEALRTIQAEAAAEKDPDLIDYGRAL